MPNTELLTSVAGLKELGFRGFVSVERLRSRHDDVPNAPGVYLVVTVSLSAPAFLKVGSGGHFKQRNPNEPIERLKREWVKGAVILYVGCTSRPLRDRIGEMLLFGQGRAIGHWGGRLVWQIDQPERLVLCWKQITNKGVEQVKSDLIQDFKEAYGGKRPFANLQG